MSPSKAADVPILKPFGQFSVVQENGCSASTYPVATDTILSTLNATNMSGWQCTTDAEFVNWDSSFTPLMVATNVSGQFVDTTTGATVSAYMLVRGADVTSLTTLQAAPTAVSTSTASSTSLPGDPTDDLSMPMSGSQDFFNLPINLVTSDGKWGLSGDVKATLSWTPQSDVAVQFDSTLVQQGASPGTTDTLNPGHGNLCTGFDATFAAVVDGSSFNLGGVSQSVCGDCPLSPGAGSAYSCSLGEQDIQLACFGIDVVNACIFLTVTPTTHVQPGPFSTDRTVLYSGTPGTGPDVLSFPPNPEVDPITVSCVEPAGTDVVYQLANPRDSAPFSNFGIELGVAGGFVECIPFTSICATQIVIDEPNLFTIPLPIGGLTLPLVGPTGQVDLGNVQKEMTVPDLTNVTATYSGNEGSPIQFHSAGAKDPCLFSSSLVWNFSDHGVAFGTDPFHIFTDAATYSGQLVVTNIGGNQATKALTITVSNLPPVVAAGPNTTAPWGVPVAFNGAATAPGADDQATLVYSWAFGDGTPSATGGPSVLHAYSLHPEPTPLP